MFEPTSRYYNLPVATLTVIDRDGIAIEVRYLQRRFIPAIEGQTTLLEHRFTEGERLDNITARYLGDPTQFWRVCDSNAVLQPEQLEQIGRVINITMPNM
jgi:hypothetical protein